MPKESYTTFRARMFDRDGRVCAHCGRPEEIELHHIKPAAEFPDLWMDEGNVTTLCRWCHSAFHGKLKKPKRAAPQRRFIFVREQMGISRVDIAKELIVSIDTVRRIEYGGGRHGYIKAYADFLGRSAARRPDASDLDTSLGYLCPDLEEK